MSRYLEALIDLSQQHKIPLTEEHRIDCYKTIDKCIKALEIIKGIDFLLEFDESQNEWFLYLSNKEQHILVANGIGVKTYDLLKEVGLWD